MKLAIFFLDAIRFQDLNLTVTPFLGKMAAQGTSGPLETLLAYEGLAATLFTGTFPSEHGIWTRYYRDPEGSPFKWIRPLVPILSRIDSRSPRAGKPLRYGLMRLSNSMAGISYFPGIDDVPLGELAHMGVSLKRNLFEPGCFGRTPSLFDILRMSDISFHYFDHGVFDSDSDVQQRAISSRSTPDVSVVRFVDLDTASHTYGLGTPTMLESLKRTDLLVGRLVSEWRRRNPDLTVLCFADHGMVPVENTINVEKSLREAGFHPSHDFGMFLDSTMARFWGESATLSRIRTHLEGIDSGNLLSQDDLSRYHLPISPYWGDLIYLSSPGVVISPNFFDRAGKVRAMHGYDPATPGLDTIAILDDPQRNKPNRLDHVRMIDILPTALDLLGLHIPSYCHGKSMVNA